MVFKLVYIGRKCIEHNVISRSHVKTNFSDLLFDLSSYNFLDNGFNCKSDTSFQLLDSGVLSHCWKYMALYLCCRISMERIWICCCFSGCRHVDVLEGGS